MIRAEVHGGLASFRELARGLLAREAPPAQVLFEDAGGPQGSLAPWLAAPSAPQAGPGGASVPRDFVPLADAVAHHRDAGRWGLLYWVLWRLTHGERHLLELMSDADVWALHALARAVGRDAARTLAEVRFTRLEREGAPHLVAWCRPEHRVLPLVATQLARRFPEPRWSVLSPDGSVHWTRAQLVWGPGVLGVAPGDVAALEARWRASLAGLDVPRVRTPGPPARPRRLVPRPVREEGLRALANALVGKP